jgi:hypothetical protein
MQIRNGGVRELIDCRKQLAIRSYQVATRRTRLDRRLARLNPGLLIGSQDHSFAAGCHLDCAPLVNHPRHLANRIIVDEHIGTQGLDPCPLGGLLDDLLNPLGESGCPALEVELKRQRLALACALVEAQFGVWVSIDCELVSKYQSGLP